MAPSQLAQLKAALSSAGLNRKSVSKKTKKGGKKGGAQEVDRAKKAAKLDEIRAKFNKFDERETKIKHNVGGRNLKGVTGKPTASRQAGIEQRRETLLKEHHLRDHRGTFTDRRFGESDPTMSLEDRMLERYTRERQRGQGKKGLFNLDDEDEFGDEDDGYALGGLTHGGRSVMDLPGDDFDAFGFREEDDEDDKGTIPRRLVNRDHFGGFDDEEEEEPEERKKTKAEVMSELIAKSKEHKVERQKQKEMDSEMREELDQGLDELRELLGGSVPNRPTEQLPGPARTVAPGANDADYDMEVRQLAFEARAKPKDRTKTEEEAAVEEKERLEQAEAKRQRRMRGEESEDEDDAGSRKKRRTDKAPDADDLDDDFMGDVDEDGGISLLGPGLTREAIESTGVDPSDDESGEDEEGSDEDDEDEDDEEDEDDDDDDDSASALEDLDEVEVASDEDDDPAPLLVKSNGKSKSSKSKTTEIPYTFPCPATVEEFEEVLEGLEDSALPTVVQRIRALHHPSLAQGNKEKLQEFLGVLLDYILILASQPNPPFDIITALGPHLAALVKLNPLTAASHFVSKLTLMQKNLQKGLARGPSNTTSKTLPGVPELAILRIIGTTWSTSDFSHPVVQPAMLLIGQYLSQSRIRSVADLGSGLFLCSIVLQYEAMSKRLVPEVINFVATSILCLVKRRKNAALSSYPTLIACDIAQVSFVEAKQPGDLVSALEGSNEPQSKADLLAVALSLVSSLANMYSSSTAFIEIFKPVLSVLEGSHSAKMAPRLKALFSQTTDSLSRQLGFAEDARQPLALQDHKPIPIASYAPRFEDDFAPGKHYDPDVERNASAKLKAEYKKERKGAIRELRKDNRFLAGEKAREQAEKDAEYNSRLRKAIGSLNVERAEEKEMEREKKREKRRAGR